MSFRPEILLSKSARERCITNLKELPSFIFSKDFKSKYTASVLVPLCIHNDEVCLLYTLRSSNLRNHSGQISFPGGKSDEGENIIDTALRETEEEIGVSGGCIDVWGCMTSVPGRSRDFIITPVVGLIMNFNFNKLKPNGDEVETIFTVPMKDLCDPNNHGHYKYEKFHLPVFLYGKHKIWGITGLITNTFLHCFLPSHLYNMDIMQKSFSFDELMPSKL